jgi:hypothetical protein
MIPDLRRFTTPDLCRFMTPDLRRFMIPDLRRFTTRSSQVHDSRRFTDSITLQWTVDSREIASFSYYFRILFENLFHEIRQTQRFEGVWFFLNSPTLAPRGSGLTPTIRFHENFRILVKNVTFGTSEWTRVLREFRNG